MAALWKHSDDEGKPPLQSRMCVFLSNADYHDEAKQWEHAGISVRGNHILAHPRKHLIFLAGGSHALYPHDGNLLWPLHFCGEWNGNVKSVFSKSPYYSLQMMTAVICVAASYCVRTWHDDMSLLGFLSSALSSLWLFNYERFTTFSEQDKHCCVNLVQTQGANNLIHTAHILIKFTVKWCVWKHSFTRIHTYIGHTYTQGTSSIIVLVVFFFF